MWPRGDFANLHSAWRMHQSWRELPSLCDGLASLLEAGLPIQAALAHLRDNPLHVHQQAFVNAARAGIDRGMTLAQAWQNQIPPLLFTMLEAGEKAGQTVQVLKTWTRHAEERRTWFNQFIRLFSYPAVLLVTLTVLLVFMGQTVLPSFMHMYDELGFPVSNSLRTALYTVQAVPKALAGLALGSALFAAAIHLASANRYSAWNWIDIHLPGRKIRQLVRTRLFCTLLYLLLDSGIPVSHAVGILKRYSRPGWLSPASGAIEQKILAGIPLSSAFAGPWHEVLPLFLTWSEQTGDLVVAVSRVQTVTSQELTRRLQRISRVAEPVTLLVMGALVAVTMTALFAPMYDLTNVLASGAGG